MHPIQFARSWFVALLLIALIQRSTNTAAAAAKPDIRNNFLSVITSGTVHFDDPFTLAPRRSMMIQDDWLKRANEDIRKYGGAEPLNPQRMLFGPHRQPFVVLDARTSAPVRDYVIHGVIQARYRAESNFIYGNEPKPRIEDKIDDIGLLESKRIRDPGGACLYGDLGPMAAVFQVWAKGYLPETAEVKIPGPGDAVVIKLTPGGAVTGRLVDDAGKPLPGVKLSLGYRDGSEISHYQRQYAAASDAQGRFRFEALPSDRYILEFPGIFEKFERGDGSVGGTDQERADFAQRLSRQLNAPYPIVPALPDVVIKDSGAVDLGTIRLERAPRLELEVLRDGKTPLRDFPFEIAYVDRYKITKNLISRTNAEGRTSLTLAGWRPGMDAIVFLPGAMDELYQVKKLADRWPDPRATFNAADYYRTIYDLTDEDRHNHSTERHKFFFNQSMLPFSFGIRHWPQAYEDLDASERRYFQNIFENDMKDMRKMAVDAAARPEHPNYLIFTPRAGEVSRIKMDYRPTPDAVDLRLVFCDQNTSEPLAGVEGFLDEGQCSKPGKTFTFGRFAFRPFRASDRAGRAVIPGVTLSAGMRDQQAKLEEGRRQEANPTALAEDERNAALTLIFWAPGYAPDGITIPVEQLRAGKELTLGLEREARVRGRLVLATTGEPLTTPTLQKLAPALTREGYPRTRIPEPVINLNWESPFLQTDGVFEFEGLHPSDGLTLTVKTDGILPDFIRRGLTLKTGMNDLGEIAVGRAGRLQGRITDEQGRGIDGVRLQIADSRIGVEDEDSQTTQGGRYAADLRSLAVTSRSLVRFIPPWGYGPDRDNNRVTEITQWYDAIVPLDRDAVTTFGTHLATGATLLVRLPASAKRAELAREYAPYANWPADADKSSTTTCFGLYRITLQSLHPNAEGFTWHQQRLIFPGGGPTTTTQSVDLRLDHVPPGPLGVRIDGGFYGTGWNRADHMRFRSREMTVYDTAPIAYAEIEMRPTTTTCQFAVNRADVEVSLANPLKGERDYEKRDETFFVLDRAGAVGTVGGFEYRDPYWSVPVPEPERYLEPLVRYAGNFSHLDEETQKYGYRPVVLRAVPPGDYRLRAFATNKDFDATPPEPYYETTVKVPRGGGRIKINFPRPERKP